MKKKNNKKRSVFLPESDASIKRYIEIYLNRKYDSSFDLKELEMQKQFIYSMLQRRGFNTENFDDLFLRRILSGEILFPLEKTKFSDNKYSKTSTKQTKNDIEYTNPRILKYQKLVDLYIEYLNRVSVYRELFSAFQDYFDPYIDVYGEHLTEQMVLSLTKTLIEPKEEKF